MSDGDGDVEREMLGDAELLGDTLGDRDSVGETVDDMDTVAVFGVTSRVNVFVTVAHPVMLTDKDDETDSELLPRALRVSVVVRVDVCVDVIVRVLVELRDVVVDAVCDGDCFTVFVLDGDAPMVSVAVVVFVDVDEMRADKVRGCVLDADDEMEEEREEEVERDLLSEAEVDAVTVRLARAVDERDGEGVVEGERGGVFEMPEDDVAVFVVEGDGVGGAD